MKINGDRKSRTYIPRQKVLLGCRKKIYENRCSTPPESVENLPSSIKLEHAGSQHPASNLSNLSPTVSSRTSMIRGLEAAGIDSEIQGSKLQGSKLQGSRMRSFYRGGAWGLKSAEGRRAMERFGKTLSQPLSLQEPRNPWISIEMHRFHDFH